MPSNICRLCQSSSLLELINFGSQPVAHDLLSTPQQKDRILHPLILHQCQSCGFIQINDYIDPELLYADYNFCFSTWKPQHHMQDEIQILKKFAPAARCLEIGCNDGVFLAPLRDAGFTEIIGIEPNPYAAAKAREKGFHIYEAMVTPELVEKLLHENELFDLVIARQVIEHIPDLASLFRCIHSLLAENGKIFLEVPNFGEALRTADCSTIWEEHTNYFTFDTLTYLLGSEGFSVLETREYNFSGGAISVLAQKQSVSSPSSRFPSSIQLHPDFSRKVHEGADGIKKFLSIEREMGRKIVLYGSGSRACTFVNGLNMKEYFDFCVDDQEDKQSLYMPGSRLPIISFNSALDRGHAFTFVLAVNHENEAKVTAKVKKRIGPEAKTNSFFAPHDVANVLNNLSS